MRAAGIWIVLRFLARTSLAGDGREAATAAVLEGRVRNGEPGVAVLVRVDGWTAFARG